MNQSAIKQFIFQIINRLIDAMESYRSEQLKNALGESGKNVYIGLRTSITSPETVFIGHDVLVGRSAWLSAVNTSIRIGD